MGAGAVLQLLLHGEEDITLHGTDAEAYKPFRQVWKKSTPYAVAHIDTNVNMPTQVTYGQAMRFLVPRKADLLRGLQVRMRVKSTTAASTAYLPGEDLIQTATLICGKQVMEEITGEYIRLYNTLHDDADARAARDRLAAFDSTEIRRYKTLYVDLPFFFAKTPLPLIAAQYQDIEVHLQFRQASEVLALDPTIEPDIQIFGEYVFLDESERLWWTSTPHSVLIEHVHIDEDRVDTEESQLTKTYDTENILFGTPTSVTGAGTESDVVQADFLQLTKYPDYNGTTTVLYNTGQNTVNHTINVAMSIPYDGRASMIWARTSANLGYQIDWVINGNDLEIYIKRNGTTIAYLTSTEVFSIALTTVTGSDTSYDITAQVAPGETWVDVELQHDLEGTTGMVVNYSIEGYVPGGKLAGVSPVSSQTGLFFQVAEGYSSVDTLARESSLGFEGVSNAYDALVTDFDMTIQRVNIEPVSDNYTYRKSKIFARGPLRWLAWTCSPQTTPTRFNTSSDRQSTNMVYDPLSAAQLLFNGKDRTQMELNSYFTVDHPLRHLHKALPTGIHLYSFAERPMTLQSDGHVNVNRLGDLTLYQRFRRYSSSVTDEASTDDLYDDEGLNDSKNFTRIVIYAMCFNVLRVVNGTLSLAYV
jgi:hypothetical protein